MVYCECNGIYKSPTAHGIHTSHCTKISMTPEALCWVTCGPCCLFLLNLNLNLHLTVNSFPSKQECMRLFNGEVVNKTQLCWYWLCLSYVSYSPSPHWKKHKYWHTLMMGQISLLHYWCKGRKLHRCPCFPLAIFCSCWIYCALIKQLHYYCNFSAFN